MADNNRNVRRRQTSRTAVVKKKSKKKIDKVTIIGFVILVLVLGGIFGAYMIQQAEKSRQDEITKQILAGALPEGVVAKVGDLEVSTSAYAIKYFSNKSQAEQEKKLTDAKAISDYWRNGMVETQTSLEWLKQTTLEQMKQFVLYLDYVNKAGFKLTEAELKDFEKSYNDNLAQQFGKGTDYKAAINSIFHVTLEAYKKYEQSSYLISKYQVQKLKELNLKVTEKQAKDYYTKNLKNYKDKKIVQHILFLTQDPTTGKAYSKEKIAAAKKSADAMLIRVKAGEDMTELVKKYSEDTGKTQNDGIYEVTAESQLVQEFKDFGLKQKTGATGIVKTSFGYHVMKQIVNGTQTFASAKKSIVDILGQTALNDLLQAAFTKAPAAKMDDDVFVMFPNLILSV